MIHGDTSKTECSYLKTPESPRGAELRPPEAEMHPLLHPPDVDMHPLMHPPASPPYQLRCAGKYEDKGLNTMYTLWKSLEIKGFLGTGGMHWYLIIGAKVSERKRTIDILGIGRVSMVQGKSVYCIGEECL